MFSKLISNELKVVVSDDEIYMGKKGDWVTIFPDVFVAMREKNLRITRCLRKYLDDTVYVGDDTYLSVKKRRVKICTGECNIELTGAEWEGLMAAGSEILSCIST